MSPRAVSFWLLPAEPARAALAAQIEELSREHAAAGFAPHITVHVQTAASLDPARTWQSVLARAAAGLAPVRVRAIGVGHSAQLFKTLFFEIELDSTLRQLQARLRGAFQRPEAYVLRPHLSLLYKELPYAMRRELADQLQPSHTWLCDRITAVSHGPGGWADIASWHELCGQRLGAGPAT